MGQNEEKKLVESIDMLHSLAEKGYVDQALNTIETLIKMIPEKKYELVYERGKLKCKGNLFREGLSDFILSYHFLRDSNILEYVLTNYDGMGLEKYRKAYDENISYLKEYDNFFHDEIQNNSLPQIVWHDEFELIFYSENKDKFEICDIKYEFEEGDTVLSSPALFGNFLGESAIRELDESNVKKSKYDFNQPIYLFFEKEYLQCFLQISHLQILLKNQRIVIIEGWDCLHSFFDDDRTLLPDICIGTGENYGKFVSNLEGERTTKSETYRKEIEEYYADNADEIVKRILSKTPRILLWTTEYNAVANNHTRYLQRALEKRGIDTRLLTCSGIHWTSGLSLLRNLSEYHPDILFRINVYRSNMDMLLGEVHVPNLVFVTWIQDPWAVDRLEEALNSDENRLLPTDVLMSHIDTPKLRRVIKNRTIIKAPCCCDDEIYKPMDLTEEDRKRYGADICFVGHQADYERCVEQKISIVPTNCKKLYKSVVDVYQKMSYECEFKYTYEEFKDLVLVYKDNFIDMDNASIDELINWLWVDVNQRLYRQVIADKLIEEGFTSIKMWGEGWTHVPRYKNYAMGTVENGEELSKVLQASKIVVGNNPMTTNATRVGETMLSGGFYLGNALPDYADVCKLDMYLEPEKEVVYFHDFNELVDKIYYYLNHEKEREEMVLIGRKCAMEHFTYTKLVQKMLDEIPSVLLKQLDIAGYKLNE